MAQFLRLYATSRKVAVSITDGVIGFFHWHHHSGRTMALGLTQISTQIIIITRNISYGVKAWGLTNLTHSCQDCQEIWESQTPGKPSDRTGNALLLIYRKLPFLLRVGSIWDKYSSRGFFRLRSFSFYMLFYFPAFSWLFIVLLCNVLFC
jgi:hypothetical protein